MTKEQRDQLEQRLLKERQRAVKAVRQLDENLGPQDEDGDLTTYPFHLADEGTDTMEQEQGFLLRSQEGRLLYDIDEALRTLYKTPERFGRCLECDKEIAFDRLEIVPWTRYCLDCKRDQESSPEAA
ncbi:MAG TPA: TraR/DksA C4-type zinc finger protein [Longimicrobiales bacterium]